MRRSRGPSASVSRWAIPDEGSSRMSTVGSWAMAMARSTMRRVPVESSATNLSRKAPRFMSSMRSSTVKATSSSDSCTAGRLSNAARWSRVSMWRSRPMATFSATVRVGKMRASWKERPSPMAARRSGPQLVTSLPLKAMRPASRVRIPEMRSKIVVFPAPLGPMRPRISCSLRSKVTSSTAVMPPKRLVRPKTSSTAGAA